MLDRVPSVPRDLRLLPFRGSAAIAAGLLTTGQLRGRNWRRLFSDVYVSADVKVDHRLLCEAAIIAVVRRRTMVAVSGLSAAYLFGVDLLPRINPLVEITVPQKSRVSVTGLRVIRSALLPADLMPSFRLPVTTPERTAFDIARRLPRINAIAAVDALLHRHLTSVDAVRAYALCAADFSGRHRVFGILDQTDRRSESPMESVLRVIIVDAGLPAPEAQIVVSDADGRFIGRLDLGYRSAKVGIEYEGDYHRDRNAFRRDLARVNALQAAGWSIVRVTVDDIHNPDRFLAQVRIALNRRGG